MAVFLYTPSVKAHPGRTAADGCHYCRTNCDSWGVPWDERHCHGGYTAPPAYIVPTASPTPKPLPTSTPSPTPTSTPAPTLTPTLIPEDSIPTPEAKSTVLGVNEANTVSDGGMMGILALLTGLVFVFWRAIKQKWPFHSKV